MRKQPIRRQYCYYRCLQTSVRRFTIHIVLSGLYQGRLVWFGWNYQKHKTPADIALGVAKVYKLSHNVGLSIRTVITSTWCKSLKIY